MHELAAFAKDHDTKPSEVVAEVLAKSGILEELQRSEDPQDASRVDNLSQLQSVAAEFEQNTPDATLAGFWKPPRWWPIPTNCQGRTKIPAR